MNQPSTIFRLQIPVPCTSSWDAMQPNEKGRHCGQCNKTVIDFTQWSDEAIQQYFILNRQGTCGRIYNTQLNSISIHIPHYIVEKRLPVWKRFLLLLLICFGSMLAVEVKAHTLTGTYTGTRDTKNKGPKKHQKKRKQKKDRHPIELIYAVTGNMGWGIPEIPMEILKPASTIPIVNPFFGTSTATKKELPQPEKYPTTPLVAALPAAVAIKTSIRKKRK